MSTNRHVTNRRRTGRRTAGVVLAMVLGPLATCTLAEPASATDSTPTSTDEASLHWHCRMLPFLC